jgi:hypothetical protein
VRGRLLITAGALALLVSFPAAAEEGGTTVWQGKVVIRGKKVIPRGDRLVIRPGTTVLFAFLDEDGDGTGESGLFIAGSVTANGTVEAPVVFAALDGEGPGRWDTVQIEEAEPSRLTNCVFRNARWALHVHFTDLILEESRFEENEGGVRFRGGPMVIRRSVFAGNGTALRWWESSPEIVSNLFAGNGTALFSREGSTGGVVTGNNFTGSRDYHVKLGELQAKDLDARGNWWGTTDRTRIEELVYDGGDDSYLGRVIFEPLAGAPLLAPPAGNPAAPPQ